jgi:Rrf2 family iron-sulfur cluster assembly transcriptional regulator
MFLTTKTKYAILSLLEIIKTAGSEAIKLSSVAERQYLDLRYLEQIFVKLRKSGVVRTIRGCRGGYMLAKPAHSIRVLEVVEAVQDKIKLTRCDGKGGCVEGEKQCHAHNLWLKLEQQIRSYLQAITLQDVAQDGSAIVDQCDNKMLCGAGYKAGAKLNNMCDFVAT